MGIASSIPVAEVPGSSREPLAGLTQQEAEQRLRQCGFNDAAPRKRGALLSELLALLLNPLTVILLIASSSQFRSGRP